MLKIRAYKIILPDGRIAFGYRPRDSRGAHWCGDIMTLAIQIRDCVNAFLRDNPLSQASIDLIPFHEIEHPEGLSPRQCVPLSPEEKENFFEHYSSHNIS